MEMSKMLLQKYGFKRPEITPDQHIFGVALDWKIQKEDGQWDEFLPLYEPQAENYETSGCTVWGTENALEILHKFLFKIEPNYSERFIAILAGITLEGGDPHTVAETIRKQGLINQELLPIPETYEEFCQPNPMEERFLAKGKKWLDDYSFRHDWVLQGKETKENRISAIKEALKYSPLGVSVSAWQEEGGVYVDGGRPNNHLCVCFGWTDNGWKIFDSYNHSIKIYSYDSEISFAKRYKLEKKTFYPEKQGNWLVDLIISFFNLIKALIK